ncbi:MAG: hypothetical protein D6702_03720 [Planctomycetota bacterium]|nr:MAG: hypothetical protein D6702_03720 [Planctomycetota bacterium]
MTEVLLSVGADPATPQEVSRTFGLNKNLTWKVSKIVQAGDPYSAYPHLPGTGGMEILLRALAKAGAPERLIRDCRRALGEFEDMVSTHAGDRGTLELLLDSLAEGGLSSRPLEISRKLAFRGNCGIWGIHASTRLTTFFLAPNAEDPSRADAVFLTGLIRLRRFRPDATLPLIQRQLVDDRGHQLPLPEEVAIDPAYQDTPGPKLLSAFCSRPIPRFREVPIEKGVVYELEPGPVGNTGAADVFYASGLRAVVPVRATTEDRFGELNTLLNTPVENLQFDLFLHRDLDVRERPQAILYGRMQGGTALPASRRDPERLPMSETVREISGSLNAVASPLVPRYPDICETVYRRMEWDPEAFTCHRLVMEYPPIPSSVIQRYRLPPAAD